MWYVSADMQLYVAAFGLLILLHRHEKSGLAAIIGLLFFSMLFSGGLVYYMKLAPTLLSDHTINQE